MLGLRLIEAGKGYVTIELEPGDKALVRGPVIEHQGPPPDAKAPERKGKTLDVRVAPGTRFGPGLQGDQPEGPANA
jgi:hypothetical protein